jgi:hypothetical protein
LSEIEDTDEGKCYDKDDETLKCNIVKNEEQCLNGLEDSSLKGMCEISGDEKECKEKCEKRNKNICSGVNSDRNDCVWIFGKTEEEGKCMKKGSEKCNDFKTSGQCLEKLDDCTWNDIDGCYSSCETFEILNNCERNEKCFWLEGVRDEDGNINKDEDEGRCIERLSVSCSSVWIGQCNDDKLSRLNIECGIYDELCKDICSSLNDDKNECDKREDDCYWIKTGEKNENSKCINKVLFYKS